MILRRLFILIFLLGACLRAQATHIFGADFFYEYIGGTSYKVTLSIYGDCSGASFPALVGSTPEVKLTNFGTLVQTAFLAAEGPGVEVTPVCPSEINNTTCKNGIIPGVTRYIYSGIFDVPAPSAGWKFTFTGNLGANGQAGRSNAISNVIVPNGGGGSVMVLFAELNNTISNNSSPRFTTIPTPFYCVNMPQQYNQGAVDPNNDSLTYTLAIPQEIGGNVSYNSGYSAADPMALGSNFTFNPATGQMNFTPTFTQKADLVNKVNEYRNGVMVGSAMREMTFVILATCNNASPTGGADTSRGTYSGGSINGTTSVFTVCAGTPLMSFRINARDPENDVVTVTSSGLPANATLNVTGNGTTNPVINFSWNLTNISSGTYNFYVTYKDNGCPFSSQQTQAFTIVVLPLPYIRPVILFPTECVHKAYVQLEMREGSAPRTVVIRQGNNIIRSFTDNTGVYLDSFATGSYTYSVTSSLANCSNTGSFSIFDSGVYPYPPRLPNAYYCLNDAAVALTSVTGPDESVFWYDSLGTRLSTPPVPNTAVAGIFRWYGSSLFKVCESKKVPVDAYVTKRPVADMFVTPAILCSTDTITGTFTGTIGVGPILEYKWNWYGGVARSGTGPGPWRIQWMNGGVKAVTLQVLENKCPSNIDTVLITVKPTPLADFTARNACQDDSVSIVYTPDALPAQQFNWSFDGGHLTQSNNQGPFQIKYASNGRKTVALTVSKDGCIDSVKKSFIVYEEPIAVITTIPSKVCMGDKIYLDHTGYGDFTWTPDDHLVNVDRDGRTYTNILKPITYTLKITNEHGCFDSDSVTWTDVEPCCNFAYPNAFTPNGDGRNDVFRVVTYGNDQYFSFGIYDRWGQRVFHTGNPKEGWDGKLNGRDADVGTYFYYVDAKCLTGYEEKKKGEFTLIR